jgi:hypothetical protein
VRVAAAHEDHQCADAVERERGNGRCGGDADLGGRAVLVLGQANVRCPQQRARSRVEGALVAVSGAHVDDAVAHDGLGGDGALRLIRPFHREARRRAHCDAVSAALKVERPPSPRYVGQSGPLPAVRVPRLR